MQRVFDIDNKEDMDLLWSILPDNAYKIEKNDLDHVVLYYKGQKYPEFVTEVCVDLHDKTEITRPVNYEDMIGCVGWIGDDASTNRIGVLAKYHNNDEYPFETIEGGEYRYFRPAKKSELKFYGKQDD